MEIKVNHLLYENALGSVELNDVVLDLDPDQMELYRKGKPIEELDYGLKESDIERAERQIGLQFYKQNYQNILTGVLEIEKDEIFAIQNFLGLNQLQFSKIIGLDRGALANIYKRNSCSHPVQILIIERLGMELVRKGSAKALYNAMGNIPNPDHLLSKLDQEASKEISHVRFGKNAA